jgi:2-oxoglutarate dehydrogenase E1 component
VILDVYLVELATGSFQETIDDTTVNKADVKTLVFCTGNYFDITAERENNGRKDVAVVRIEQLFPLPVEQLKAIIAQYQMQMITFGHKKNQKYGGLQLYVNEFRFSKMEISFLKGLCSTSRGKLYKSKTSSC